MILTNKIKVKISKKNIEHFKNLGKKIKLQDIVEINPEELNNGSHILIEVKCDICNKEKELSYQKYVKNIKNGGYYACCSKCAQDKVKKTSIINFGSEYYMQTEEYRESVNKTSKEKYGVEHFTQAKKVIDKQKKTNLEKYAVENVFASEKIKEKIKETNLERYGVENPSYSTEIKEKISHNIITTLRNKLLKENPNIINIEDDIYEMKCDNNKNHNYKINRLLLANRKFLKTTLCTVCFPPNSYTSSGLEILLREFIVDNYKGDIEFNSKKIISPYELDIYLPELKLAFEFNGVYWHNELNKSKDYHLIKHNLCKDKNIELIQIWQDSWIYKNDIVKSIILNKLNIKNKKIFARKCDIRIVNDNDKKNFLNNNHLQGNINSNINIGLYYNEKLISIMTFGKIRNAMGNKGNSKEYELYRYCNKLGYTITGGASKILNYFISKYEYDNLYTYFSRDLGFKNLYEKIGFEYISESKPNYFYVIDGIRKHRYSFRKDKLIKEGFNPEKTEHQIMLERNIFRIYDSGNLKYKYIMTI
jgi:hypothetical protein